MKVRKILIYQGEDTWVKKTLEHSLAQKDFPFQSSYGSITVESEEVIEE
jgi:hypothetical protein